MAETTDAAANTAGVRSSLLTSLPLTNIVGVPCWNCMWSDSVGSRAVTASASAGSRPASMTAQAVARQRAPVSRYKYPNREANNLATVLLPTPAGPSIATISCLARFSSATLPKLWLLVIAVTGAQSIIPLVHDETPEMIFQCTPSHQSRLESKRLIPRWPVTSPHGDLHDCGHAQPAIDHSSP